MNNNISIKEYSPKSDDVFFFDNNIWMYLFCEIGNYQKDKKQRVYSSFLNQIISRKLPIFVTSLVLSEFCNSYLRLDFNIQKMKPENAGMKDYKRHFVGTPLFNKAVTDVKIALRKIISISQKSSDEFNSIDFESVLNGFSNIDFNDSYYFELAHKKKWVIVTDDADFFTIKNKKVKILSANVS